jgi:hypothetical protein
VDFLLFKNKKINYASTEPCAGPASPAGDAQRPTGS